ncbi:MAG: hypothetical protein Q4F21_10180 [Lachnospiraceae bacterium]|nr:hypothetical protein [Lachnospiraceae bacterium]
MRSSTMKSIAMKSITMGSITMKKFLAVSLAVIIIFSLTACSSAGDKTEGGGKSAKIDLSAYPADFNEWTVENIMDYFTKAGLFTKEDWKCIQNEDECAPAEIGISRIGSYMSDDENGNQSVFIFWFDPAASESKVKEQFEFIKANKTFDSAFDMQPVDHVIGNFAICYSISLEEDFYNAADAAYKKLVEDMKITPAF